ncbi:MAG: M42 family metallopeptidase [Anaerolineae bacterium]|nr:M42 family metallopeptidase [Anaerolineae bacterium]
MTSHVNVDRMVEFLVELLQTPSPTGDTEQAMRIIQNAFAPFPFTMEMTPKGMLIGRFKGERADAPRALTAHVDTLGAMVQRIKKNGRLLVTQLGGWVWSSVEGENVTVFASNGEWYRGTFMPVASSIHAHEHAESAAKRSAETMEVRLDAHTDSAEATRELGIRVGDMIVFDPRVELTPTGFIKSRHLDDKASIATIYGAVAALVSEGRRPYQDTLIHIANYEEVGHGAAAGISADIVELVSVDMAVVAHDQQSNEYSVTICAKDTRGPYDLGLRRKLERLAEAAKLRWVTDVYPYYGSDGEAFWRAGGDVAVGLLGPGVDASHHYERTHRDALRNSAELIRAYMLSP